jgi:hypothetical protein
VAARARRRLTRRNTLERVLSTLSRLDELRAEYHRLIHSMEFAYAMGHSRTIDSDPRLPPYLDRERELRDKSASQRRGEPPGE